MRQAGPYGSAMEIGDWATWVGSTAAVVAAAASVAAWRNSRPGVTWRFDYVEQGRSLLTNSGSAVARHVRVRAGSASDESHAEAVEEIARLTPGEGVRILVTPSYDTYQTAPDFAIVVTWRGPLGRTRRWTHFPD